MDSEGQQTGQPSKGTSGQSGQDDQQIVPTGVIRQVPQPEYAPASLPLDQFEGNRPPTPPQYLQPVQDMGSTLSYGPAMGYPYYSQPSQPLPLLQYRLRQLREERLRRQQPPEPPSSASSSWRKLLTRMAKNRARLTNQRSQAPDGRPISRPPVKSVPLAQFSPAISLPSSEAVPVFSADSIKVEGPGASVGLSQDS